MQGTNGTGIWAGNVVNLGGAASWRPGADTGGSLIFTGNALQGGRNFIIPRGTVQFASNAVISATGTATALGRDGSANNRSANVTFKDNAVANLGVCSLGGGKSGGSVTVTVQNNAALSFGANSLDLHNVTRATAVTTLRLNGGTITVGGFTKTQTTYTNGINFNGGLLRAGSNNPAFLPAFSKQTAIVQAGGAIIDDGGLAITISQPLIHDSTLGATVDGGLTKLGAGTLTLAGANTYTGPTLISAGTLALSGSGSIANSTNVNVAAGALFDVSGTAGGGFTLASGCTLMGNGSVKGNFTLGVGAYLAPGSNAIGRLTFSNAVAFAAGSTNLFALSKSPLTNDAVFVLGSLSYGGTLIVTNVSTTLPGVGDSFKLFDAGSYSGNFSTFILPGLDAGLAWDTSGLTNNGSLTVVSLAPPVLSSPTPLGDGTFRLLFSGTAGQNYELRGATNVALTPLTSWSLLTSGIFGASPVTFDDLQATNYPQRFYRLRVP
jgi:autotransporter-associated beta strand protein